MAAVAETEVAEQAAGLVATDVGKWLGAGVTSWTVSKILTGIFGGRTTGVTAELQTIIDNQQKILQGITAIEKEIDWTALTTEVEPAVDRIQSGLQDMLDLAGIADDTQRQTAIKRWVEGALDEANGFKPALFKIHQLAIGDQPLAATSTGLLEGFLQKLLDRVYQNSEKVMAISVYHGVRAYLGTLFHLQYAGTVMLANAQIQSGVPDAATEAVNTLRDRLDAQTKLLESKFPPALSLIAALDDENRSFVARIKSATNGAVVTLITGESFEDQTITLQHATGSDTELWEFIHTDSSNTQFLIVPVSKKTEQSAFQFENKGSWYLAWWQKGEPENEWITEARYEAWQIVPSTRDPGKILIKNQALATWEHMSAMSQPNGFDVQYVAYTKPYIQVTSPDAGALHDVRGTRWTLEIDGDLPKVFP